jgi:arylformamidase
VSDWIDVTRPILTGMAVVPGDPEVRVERALSIAGGSICNLSSFAGTLHAGTHIDAPVHFIEGAGGIETTPLDALVGPCVVVDARGVAGHITAGDIARLVPAGSERVLFKTTNGTLWDSSSFERGYVALLADAAHALVARGVRLVGIDYLSVAPFEDPAPVHVALLAAGVVILEGLDLRTVEPGPYDLVCLPLLVPGADGAPARALLRQQ